MYTYVCCTCMCVYIYIYIYICMYAYIHTYIHTYTHTYIHTHTHIHTNIHTYIHTYIQSVSAKNMIVLPSDIPIAPLYTLFVRVLSTRRLHLLTSGIGNPRPQPQTFSRLVFLI